MENLKYITLPTLHYAPPGGFFDKNYELRHVKHSNQVSSNNHSPLIQKNSKKYLQKLN